MMSDSPANELAVTLRTPDRTLRYVSRMRSVWDALATLVSEQFSAHKLVVIIDENVHRLYADSLQAALKQHSQLSSGGEFITIAPGEHSKSRATKDSIEDKMFALGCGRDTCVIAVGGGVVGDLAGYVAATFMRGVPLIHVPTTLLAMVDSSIGGKTGINHHAGKNMLGAFYQPEAIFAGIETLRSLPSREYRSGLAEVLKYAATLDMDLWETLERHATLISTRAEGYLDVLEGVILRSAAWKMNVVEQDERESGLRAILNFGHTTGHAYEALSAFSIPHGYCVAAGMRVALRLSERLLGYPAALSARFDALLERYELCVDYSRDFSHEAVWTALLGDKKSRAGVPRFVLMRSASEYVLAQPVEREDFLAVLASFS
jgi:3-dehydroquinate synthase